jgi:hypothetical protein
MQSTWFDLHWPSIGLAFSAVLLLLLFATNIFRSDRSKSRWFDPIWLAWLAPADGGKSGQEPFCFRGRPRGRNSDSSPSRTATDACHVADPNGWPR